VFYTEADQILHLRTTQVFAPLLREHRNDSANRRSPADPSVLPAVLIPHRFHSVPSVADFRHVDHAFNDSAVFTALAKSASPELAFAKLLLESATHAGGGGGGSGSGSGNSGGGSGGGGRFVDPNAYEWFYPGPLRPTIRRELELYESRVTTRFPAPSAGDSCCFLREVDDRRGPGHAYTGGNAGAAALALADAAPRPPPPCRSPHYKSTIATSY